MTLYMRRHTSLIHDTLISSLKFFSSSCQNAIYKIRPTSSSTNLTSLDLDFYKTEVLSVGCK